MKKSILIILVLLAFAIVPMKSYASKAQHESANESLNVSHIEDKKGENAKTEVIIHEDETAPDKSEIKEQSNAVGGGVYISAGSLILIIVLLIIFL
ncbi:MAG: hypothetical protein V4613_04670 [Bacteroidota bacterium]